MNIWYHMLQCVTYIDRGHSQYLVYGSKSSIFEECIIDFQVLVYKQMLSFFEECIIVFQAPAQVPKNKDVLNTTHIWIYIYMCII